MTLPRQSDELGTLMQAAQSADAGAYLHLLRTITPRIRQIITRQRGFAGAEVVEDLVQDVLLSLHPVRATYDSQRPFMPWLLGAAFASVVPGASPRVLLWPAAAVAVWLGSLLVGSLQEWQAIETIALAPQREWLCVAMIALGGALPALGMAIMLRHGAPLRPRATTALAVLAATGLANVGACVSHPHPSSAVVLIWHGATILALVAVSAWAGHSVLSWDRLR